MIYGNRAGKRPLKRLNMYAGRTTSYSVRDLLRLKRFMLQSYSKRQSSRFLNKKHNYYDVLGVESKATASDIKSAYYDLSLAYHPDRNQSEDAKQKYQLINEAYEVLGSYDSRKTYDRSVYSGKKFERPADRTPNQQDPYEKNTRSESDYNSGPDVNEDYTQFFKRRQRDQQSGKPHLKRAYVSPSEDITNYDYDHSRATYDAMRKSKEVQEKIMYREEMKRGEKMAAENASFLFFFLAIALLIAMAGSSSFVPQKMIDSRKETSTNDEKKS